MSRIIVNGKVMMLPSRGPAGPDGNPIGTVISFMGLNPPQDYLVCDGSIYKKSDYPDLSAFFKEQFGSETYFGSNGDNTFAVPDMRNLFLRGYHGDSSETISGDIGKMQDGTWHSNSWGDSSGSAITITDTQASAGNTYDKSTWTKTLLQIKNATVINHTINVSKEYTSRPINMAVLYCIKAVSSEKVVETGSAGEIYSEEEVQIGTWMGKPLYRRIHNFTIPKADTDGETLLTVSSDLNVMKIYGMLQSPTYVRPLPLNFSKGNIGLYFQKEIHAIRVTVTTMAANYPNYLNVPAVAIIEYTKSTDQSVFDLQSNSQMMLQTLY